MSTENDKGSRKEVFDYLRQLQKREEQSSKVSGMSTWVLIAAFCYLSLWLLQETANITDIKIATLGLAAGLEILFFTSLITPFRSQQDPRGTRLTQLFNDDPSLIGLNICVIAVSPVLPTIASYYLFGWTFPVLIGTLLSAAWVIYFLLGPLLSTVMNRKDLRRISKNNKKANLIGTIAISISLVIHARDLFSIAQLLPNQSLIFSAHIAALWWISHHLLRSRYTHARLNELESLEEALMFEVLTPNQILKKLELQTFGPTLEYEIQLLDREIEKFQTEYSAAKEKYEQAIGEIKAIPVEYQSEINARLSKSLLPLLASLESLVDAINTKVDFVKSLLSLASGPNESTVKELLIRESNSLAIQQSQAKTELNRIKGEFQKVVPTSP